MPSSSPSGSLVPAATRALRILIVDDDDLDRERIRRVLMRTALPLTCLEASTGTEAVTLLRSSAVDCILLDHRLGETTGPESIHTLRVQAMYDGPIVVVTGAGSESVVVEAMQEGASDYVSKLELEPERLTQAILRSVRKRKEIADEKATARRLSLRVEEQARTLRELGRTLQDVLDHSPNLIAYWDRGERVRFGNVAHHAWFGMPQAEVVGMRARDLLGEELYAVHAPHVAAALAGESRQFEYAMPARGGLRSRIVRAEYRPDVDERGSVQGFYVTLSDFTELAMARDAAKETARLKGTFLAHMSHEIRTPMNGILGLLRIALDRRVPSDVRADLERAEEAAKTLMSLLDDVLDHAKIEAGQLEVVPEPARIDEILARSVELFSGNVALKGLVFRVEVGDDVPTVLRMDALRISQILNNLLGNAVKFTPAGSITLAVRWLEQARRVRFEVHDTGTGVPRGRQSVLFSAFTQADDAVSRRQGGTGLGLSICRDLVERMRGEIGFESTPGVGSVFWFEVPLEPCAEPNGDEASPGRRRVLYWGASDAVPNLWRRIPELEVERWTLGSNEDEVRRLLRDRAHPFDAIVVDWTGSAEALRSILESLDRERSASDSTRLAFVLVVDESVRATLAEVVRDLGDVHVRSRPVVGPTLLRAMPDRPPKEADTHAEPPVRWFDSNAIRGRRALLVEDDPLNQAVARAYLEQVGMTVVVVGDGREVIDHASNTTPPDVDVVLMDMHLPGIDGPEASRRILGIPAWRSIPIVAMTGAAFEDDRRRCLAAGMVDVVTKPVSPEELVRVLVRHLVPD